MCCHRRFEWSLGEAEFVEVGVEQIAYYVGIYATIVEERRQGEQRQADFICASSCRFFK